MTRQKIVHIDAFTDRAFSGNAAAVCVLSQRQNTEWMQRIAQETNLAATVFVREQTQGFDIRWFTPSHELPLCGHGTLAAAHALWTEGHCPCEAALTFHAHSHILTATLEEDWIRMDFPAIRNTPIAAPDILRQWLCVEPRYVGRSHHSYLVEVGSASDLRALTPNPDLLLRLDLPSVIVTCRADDGPYDFISRCFVPIHGIPEDPATGSAHCAFGPYWAERLGKTHLTGYQASARGGVVRIQVEGDRVTLGGQAVTVLRSELCVENGA
jgi:PhzF family phenazine biosynthesis protein